MRSETCGAKFATWLSWVVRVSVITVATVTAVLFSASASLALNDDVLSGASLTTQERMYVSAWWPTKGASSAKEYSGEESCAKCHSEISVQQHKTPMYHAATPASRFAAQLPLKFQEGQFNYSLERSEAGATYRVGDGISSDMRPVVWAFGNSETGQTYLLKKQKDGYIESRLSYYTSPNALDITVGHSASVPSGLHGAFGHELTSETTQLCFGCHTTASTVSGTFAPNKGVPGVTCEACHGPGAAHIAAASSGQRSRTVATITNPASMSPADSVDFCGACHRTFSDVTVFMPANIGTVSVRFQPYRLEKSRCWGKNGDARITCIACHDPHKPLVHEATAYDANCLACHRQRNGHGSEQSLAIATPACKIANRDCVSCHMPKVEVPQTHARFTDHLIRIVRTKTLSGSSPSGLPAAAH